MVESAALEMRYRGNSIGGSNPSLSAISHFGMEIPSKYLKGMVVFGVRNPSSRSKPIRSGNASLSTVLFIERVPLFQSFQGFDRKTMASSNISSKGLGFFAHFARFSDRMSLSSSNSDSFAS